MKLKCDISNIIWTYLIVIIFWYYSFIAHKACNWSVREQGQIKMLICRVCILSEIQYLFDWIYNEAIYIILITWFFLDGKFFFHENPYQIRLWLWFDLIYPDDLIVGSILPHTHYILHSCSFWIIHDVDVYWSCFLLIQENISSFFQFCLQLSMLECLSKNWVSTVEVKSSGAMENFYSKCFFFLFLFSRLSCYPAVLRLVFKIDFTALSTVCIRVFFSSQLWFDSQNTWTHVLPSKTFCHGSMPIDFQQTYCLCLCFFLPTLFKKKSLLEL